MGVSRTDYLMWGCKVSTDQVQAKYDDLEPEMYEEDGRRFDLIYDGMCGKYAVAGKIVAKSNPSDGLEFMKISDGVSMWDEETVAAVTQVFPGAHGFGLILFSHFH